MVTLAIVEAIIALPVRLAVGVRGTVVIVFALWDAMLTVSLETVLALAIVEAIIALPVRLAVGVRGAVVVVLARRRTPSSNGAPFRKGSLHTARLKKQLAPAATPIDVSYELRAK